MAHVTSDGTEPLPLLDRSLDDIRVGESASLVALISDEGVAAFAQLSGDRNPLHLDDSYARTTSYARRIAHGQLVAAPISALAGHLLPGKRCLMLEIRLRFVRPVFLGDRLTYRGTVSHVTRTLRAVKVRVQVTNDGGEIVLRGSYACQLLAEA